MQLHEQTFTRIKIICQAGGNHTTQNKERFQCKSDPVYWINRWAWTYDPREQCTTRPFDLFPKQEEFIHWLAERDRKQECGLAEKSRDVGFTWLCAAYAVHCWLFKTGDSTGFGSRKLDLVDDKDNPDCIFEKIRFLIYHLPHWMLPAGFEPHHDKYCTIVNPSNGSTITGEGGAEIGRGARKSRYIVDEAAYIPNPKTADASLSQTTRVRIDVSTPNGTGNPFHTRRFNGTVPVFTFHWRDDPRKDDAWYEREKLRLADPVIIAQELDIDYSASIEGVCIPAHWVRSAVELNLPRSGYYVAGWDIADEGKAFNVLIVRQGPVITDVQPWAKSDIIQSTHHVMRLCRELNIDTLNYDCIGVGAGVKGTFNARERESPRGLDFTAKAVNVGDQPTDSRWPDGKTSKERFRNLRAELWWKLRERFEKTYAYTIHIAGDDNGINYPVDELISIPDHAELIAQLSMPLHFYTETGKIQIESKKDMKQRGIASPDFADALVLAFASNGGGGWQEAARAMTNNYTPEFKYGNW